MQDPLLVITNKLTEKKENPHSAQTSSSLFSLMGTAGSLE